MTKDYYSILHSLLSKYPKEEALLEIFELLRQEIPFEKILCCKTDRETKLVNILIEYSLTERIIGNSYRLEYLLPMKLVEKERNSNLKKIYLRNRLEKNVKFFEQLNFDANSVLFFPFQISEDFSSFMFVTCFTSQIDAFNEEHVELLGLLRPFLEKIVFEMYQSNYEPQVFLASKIALPSSYEEQLSACPNLHSIVKEVKTIAPYNITTLITGPHGSGKELIAKTIHTLSTRANNSFVEVNCAAIPESLLESELFGFERGAFTGAVQAKRGYFEQADKGTIFLDEIGEMSLNSQARLLRVLENKKIQRIGSERSVSVDARIIVATNKNLEELVRQEKFREDLYYRIKGFHIEIPPLRKRKLDIKYLIKYFYALTIEKNTIENPPTISYQTVNKLIEYDWPGNVRQLKHAIEEAVFKAISKERKDVEFDFLNSHTLQEKGKRQNTTEISEILNALKNSLGKISGENGAAQALNIHPATLRSRMKALGIPFKKERKIKKIT